MKDQFYAYIENLQDKITSELEKIDGKADSRKTYGKDLKVVVEEQGL